MSYSSLYPQCNTWYSAWHIVGTSYAFVTQNFQDAEGDPVNRVCVSGAQAALMELQCVPTVLNN